MPKNIRHLIQEHHAFYEVRPYYVVLEEGHGTPAVKTRRIQAGFDVDVYGVHTTEDPTLPGPDYALACASLLDLMKTIALPTTGGCSIEVIPFGSTVFFDTKRHLQPEGMLRVRITNCRGLDQPAGQPEQRALEEIEKELQSLGIGSGMSHA